ncbi:MAG: hypothetical protein ACQESH_02395 [Campylobacterota bacterium]
MKKILLILTLTLSLYAKGDAYMGQTYYMHFLAPTYGKGSEFTKLYSTQEWSWLFQNGAEGFYDAFEIEKGSFSQEELSHLEAFMKKYAKDSDVVATCR